MSAPTAQAAAPSELRALTILRVRGVPLRIHWTLLVALPAFAWLMATLYFGNGPAAWLWGGAVAASLFASVALHEFAHTLMSLRLGVPIREIILLPIGGASIMDEPARDPRKEFAIAIVGPLLSLGLGGALLGAAIALGIPLTFPRAVPHAPAFLLTVGYLNLTLGIFNLFLPAFPMDGGRVLRAALAARLGIVRATQIAGGLGRGLAFLMGALGLLSGNILLVIVAFFVWSGARAEEESVTVSATLDGYALRDIMTTSPATIPPEATLARALDVMLDTKHLVLPVTDPMGKPVALLRAEQIAQTPPAERGFRVVGDVATADIRTMAGNVAAPQAMAEVLRAGLVAVVDATGRLAGVVTPTDILRIVRIRSLARDAS